MSFPEDRPSTKSNTDTAGAIVVAGVSNLGIVAAKLVAGLLSGSAAMLSEAVHSAADTVTEILLYVAGRSAARPMDKVHPLGYGRGAFLWALLASFATFVFGAGFSITHGMQEFGSDSAPSDIAVNMAVLAVSVVLESLSLRRSRRETRARALRWQTTEIGFLRATSDTALRAVVLEDVVALAGLALAAAGLLASAATGDGRWDALASIAVGVLLLIAAYLLARRNLSVLIGRSAPPRLDEAVIEEIAAAPQVVAVRNLVTQTTGPGRYLVLAQVDFDDELTADQVERAAYEIDHAVRRRIENVDAVYVHPVSAPQ